MKFGSIGVSEAIGTILAHGVRVGKANFKKGRILTRDDIEILREEGIHEVIAVKLETGDVHENDAAATLAGALAGAGLRLGRPHVGRMNLFAEHDGSLVLDACRIHEINATSEAMTVACLEDGSAVGAGQMVATIKLVTFSIDRGMLDQLVRIASQPSPTFSLAHYQPFTAMLIQSTLPGTRAELLDKTERVTRRRVESLGGTFLNELRGRHEADALQDLLKGALEFAPQLILFIGASATVDRRDVFPGAMTALGGSIERFGLPVDPGNLLLVGRLGECCVLGLPGSSRSPRESGFDRVLRRFASRLPIDNAHLGKMGVGGLMKEIPSRPAPRSTAEPEASVASVRPRFGVVLLAAGQSRRMGTKNKLLEPVDGVPMLVRAIRCIREVGFDELCAVTGFERERIEPLLAEAGFQVVYNPLYEEGLSSSLRRGLAALSNTVDAYLICLADMPLVQARHLERLLGAFAPDADASICVPTHRGKRGNPVLWANRYRVEMMELRGDVGARHLLGEYEQQVREVEFEDPAVLADVDTPQALAELIRRSEPSDGSV